MTSIYQYIDYSKSLLYHIRHPNKSQAIVSMCYLAAQIWEHTPYKFPIDLNTMHFCLPYYVGIYLFYQNGL